MPRKKRQFNPPNPLEPPKPQYRHFKTNSPASPFVVLRINGDLLTKFGQTDTQSDQLWAAKQARLLEAKHNAAEEAAESAAKQTLPPAEAVSNQEPREPETQPADPEMKTRNAWDKNLANPANRRPSPTSPPKASGNAVSASPAVQGGRANKQATPLNGVASGRVQKSIPKPGAGKQSSRRSKKKSVAFDEGVDVAFTDAALSDEEEELNDGTDKENEVYTNESPSSDLAMAEAERPKLKLKMSTLGGAGAQPAIQPMPTPVPQSATQRLKLSFGRKPSIIGEVVVKEEDSPEPGSASKKRKRNSNAVDEDDDTAPRKPSIGPRKITLKTKVPPAQTPGSAITPHVKFHVKGKVPPRRLGVGYDSENEDTERDPVILEGFILRMQPGPDCDYVQQAIANGTIGLSKLHGGAGVSIRMLDTHGRRGILIVRSKQYATTLVDLPCIVEAMKSWDRKSFIKSIDICQMLLVLGLCKSDDEARNYPLPADVSQANYQYAHGITPPMHYVRKRRFEKTKRTKVDDIEAVERKVNALIAEDGKAIDSSFEILDHDPRDDESQYSGTEEESEDEDADGEIEASPDDYFGQHAEQGGNLDTRQYPETGTPQEMEVDMEDEDFDEFARELEEEQRRERNMSQTNGGLHPPDDSSFAVTSTSASPSASANATAAQTPASGGATTDEEGDEDEDADADDDEKSESGKEDDENLQQTKDRIAELEEKIQEQKETLKKTQNTILKRKIATKIGELEKDVGMMRRGIGLGEGEDGE